MIHTSDGQSYESETEFNLSSFLDDNFKQFSPGQQTNFETPLNAEEEKKFQSWKQENAPKDSGFDYDFRGAYLDNFKPDPETGHWPDKYKKPIHPTFSDQSQYAPDAQGLAGSWNGEDYIAGWARQNVPLEQLSTIDTIVDPPEAPKPASAFNETGDFLSPQKTAEHKSFVDKLKETWPAKMVESFVDALKLPGEVYQGKVDLNSPEGSQRVTEMALNLGVGGLAVAPMKPGLGMFGGRFSQEARTQAIKMEQEGFSDITIKEMTGLERGADYKWRREIDDSAAKFNPMPFNEGNLQPLSKVLDHPELYKTYPELKDLPVLNDYSQIAKSNNGAFVPSQQLIKLNPMITSDQSRSTLLHEIQHAIQDAEGFSLMHPSEVVPALADKVKGKELKENYSGTIKAIADLVQAGKIDEAQLEAAFLLRDAERAVYRNLASEVEARNVQARAGMSEKQRSKALASDTEDVPRADQITTKITKGGYNPDLKIP